MQLSIMTLSATLLSLSTSLPTLSPRNILAGGPSVTRIPSNCTLQHVFPASRSPSFSATSAFSSAHGVFTINYPPGFNSSEGRTQCLEQCYGFGNPGDCVAALWAQNVTYSAYGATNVGDICVMYGAYLCTKDLVAVTDGEYLNAVATNIRCPSPRGN